MRAQTDEECLDVATTVRVLLIGPTEKIAEALKDQTELNAAVTLLCISETHHAGVIAAGGPSICQTPAHAQNAILQLRWIVVM